ncbi:hypothetical protein N6H14_02300 [Paenibacillus sp. CC-CFT747]|nr:hypothetical protein N6H14_02300 [Paenibacillus sp. CC-CFT747]
MEYVATREMAINAGRLFGTLLFIAVISWSRSPLVINSLLLFIGSTPLIMWACLLPLLERQAHTGSGGGGKP